MYQHARNLDQAPTLAHNVDFTYASPLLQEQIMMSFRETTFGLSDYNVYQSI